MSSPSASLPERRQREDEPNTPDQQPHHVMTQPVFLQKILPFATVSPLRLKAVSSSWSETIVHYAGATICWINFFNKQMYKEKLLMRCINQALKLCSDSLWIIDACCEVASALEFEIKAPKIHYESNGRRDVYFTELGESLYRILLSLSQLPSSSTWNAALLNKFIRAVMFRIISLAEIEEIFTFSAEVKKRHSYDRTLMMRYCSNEDASYARVMTEVFKLIDEMKMNESITNNGSNNDGSALETNHEECSSYVMKQMEAEWRCGECYVKDSPYCYLGGHTPLMHAIASSSLDVVKTLVCTFREMESENRYLIKQLQMKPSNDTSVFLLPLAFSSKNCERKRDVLIFLIDTMCSLDDGGQLFSEQVCADLPHQYGSGSEGTPLYLACFHDMPEVVSHLARKVREVCGDEILKKLLELRVHNFKRFPTDGYCPIHIACSRASVATVESIMSAAESLGKEFLDNYLQSLCHYVSKRQPAHVKTPLLCCLEHLEDEQNMERKLRFIIEKIRSSLGINSLRKQFDLMVSPSLPHRLTAIEIDSDWSFEQLPFAATDFLVFEFIEGILGTDAFGKFLELQHEGKQSFFCEAFGYRSLGYCKRLVEKTRTKFGDEFLANQFVSGEVFRDAVFGSSVRILEFLVALIRSVGGNALLNKQFGNPHYDLLRAILKIRRYSRVPRFLTDLILEVSGKEMLTRYFDAERECPDDRYIASALEIAANKCMYSRYQDDFVKTIFVLSRLPLISSETAKALLMKRYSNSSFTVLGMVVQQGHIELTRYALHIIEKIGGEDFVRENLSCAASSDGRPLLYKALLNERDDSCRRVVRFVMSMMSKLFSHDVLKTMFAMTSYTVSPPIIWIVRESNSLDLFCSVFREVDPDGYEQQLKYLDKMRDDEESSIENKAEIVKEAIAALEKKYADEEIVDDSIGEIDPDGSIVEMIDGIEFESNTDDSDCDTGDEENVGEDCAVELSDDDKKQ